MYLLLFSKGGKAFLESLLPRLNPKNNNGGPSMPFELEVSKTLHLSIAITEAKIDNDTFTILNFSLMISSIIVAWQISTTIIVKNVRRGLVHLTSKLFYLDLWFHYCLWKWKIFIIMGGREEVERETNGRMETLF